MLKKNNSTLCKHWENMLTTKRMFDKIGNNKRTEGGVNYD